MFSYLHQPKGFYKHLFLLALPVIVQNLITTSLGFLDTFMVGLLGSDQMSAVTVANVPVFIIQLVVFGLQSGSSVLISQYWGRGDRESINRVMGIGFMIAGGVSVLFAAILCAFPAQVLYLITDNLTLVELAEPYLRIVGFSYIFNSLSSIYIGMQRSIENPRFGMIVFAISMLCNTLGNYVLIFGKLGLPALGITGAAVATLLSRVVEFVVAFSYAFRCRTMPLIKHAILRPGMDMLRKFLRYSAPVLINETLWGTGFSMITVIMGHMANSSDLIAAYTLAGNIDKLMTSGVFGIAAAVSVIVGKEIGTGNLKGVYNIGRALCFTAFAFGIVLGLTEYTMFVTLMRPFVMPLFSLSAVAERCLRHPAAQLFNHDGRRRAARRRRCECLACDRQFSPLVRHAAHHVPFRPCAQGAERGLLPLPDDRIHHQIPPRPLPPALRQVDPRHHPHRRITKKRKGAALPLFHSHCQVFTARSRRISLSTGTLTHSDAAAKNAMPTMRFTLICSWYTTTASAVARMGLTR